MFAERALLEVRAATSSALQVDAINLEESGFNAVNELHARGVEFDAIVAASDLIAIGALGALQAKGVEVPRDVEVRVHDSAADLRYIVLPMRPKGTKGWSEQDLASLVTRDCMIGTALPQAPARSQS